MSLLHNLLRDGATKTVLDTLRDTPAEELAKIINAPEGDNEETPLHIAVYAKRSELIPALIKAGADPSIGNFHENRPLDVAIVVNAAASAKALLEGGADANAPLKISGQTPLMLAASMDSPKVAELLLEHGADVGIAHAENGKNVFFTAADYGAGEILDLLLRQPGAAEAVQTVIGTGRETLSPLRIALARGDFEMAEKLIDYGVSINETDEYGETPLFHVLAHHADRDTAMEAVQFLLRHGADVEKIRNMWDENVLFPAARSSFPEAVALLVSLGVDAAHQSRLQDTPLHLTAGTWDGASARVLIAAGAGLEVKDRIGRTPLHIAADKNKEAVVKALLEAGADPFALDRDSKKPSDLTPAHFQDSVRRLLLQKEEEAEIRKYGRDMYNQRRQAAEKQKKPQFHNPSAKPPFKHKQNRR